MSKRDTGPKLRVIEGGGRAGDEAAPSMTVAQQAAAEEFRRMYCEQEREIRRVAADLDRLRYAIVDLAAIELPPARLIAELSPTLDVPVVRERLARAMGCLALFADAWLRQETGKAS